MAHLRPAPLAFAFSLFIAPTAPAQVGALQTDCGLGGGLSDGSYQFVSTCAGRAQSPDGRLAIVQRAYRDAQPPIELRDDRDRTLASLPGISDNMPFSVSWAPNSRWFFVNHHVGSFMDELKVFEIVGNRAVERPALHASAVRIATDWYPCLPPGMVRPRGYRWTADSRRVVLVTLSATYACHPDFSQRRGTWRPLWMIGDVRTGRVVTGSVRAALDSGPLEPPRDGQYRRP